MNFKVGQKVRILPSATYDGVCSEDIGKEGVIIIAKCQEALLIKMMPSATRLEWWISSDNVKLSLYKGQQLLLWDDVLETE